MINNKICGRAISLSLITTVFFFAHGSVQTAVAQTWIELTPVGSPPDPIFFPKPIHYDAANNRLIAFFPGNPPFGGVGNQVWVLTNANGLGGTPTWTQLQPQGSPPFSNGLESVVYDPVTNSLIVYGGCFANCSPALSNVFVLTNANGLGGTPVWSQISVSNPQPRTHHSAVYDPQNNLMITFGGHFAFFGTDQNDTRVLSNANGIGGVSTWTTLSISGSIPPIRSLHTTVYDAVSNRMLLFAGANLQKNFCCGFPSGNMTSTYDDLWILANANGLGGTPTWLPQTPLGTVPPSRLGHSAVYDPTQNKMIVFGGTSITDFTTQTSTRLGDLWELSHANGLTGTPTWNQLSQAGSLPGPRSFHTAAFDAANQRMILLGGRDQNDVPSNRVWVLVLTQTVAIDIKPGSDPNSINCKNEKGVIPVAILTTDDFDAITVDHTTVRFGRDGTEAAETHTNKKSGEAKRHEEDVDGDGDIDLVFHFRFGDTGIQCGDEEAVLTGETFDGQAIEGRDDIRTVEGGARKSVAVEDEAGLPASFTLYQNYPNPFNPETEIRFGLPKAGHVVLRIYNTLGQEIRRLVDGDYAAGLHSVSWDGKDAVGKDAASGVYLLKLEAGNFVQIRKMSLVR